ncbi:MAG: helix-turn-helix domain-containing protein [Eubacterium sp.]|jgi:sugar-specific transcriptional regulator TrmB|nr:helix-turn-helix domain-containing protein [Eubacterium sp.]
MIVEKIMMTAKEVSETLGVKQSKAYSIIRELNQELCKKGYLTVAGKISRIYFHERIYGAAVGEKKEDGQVER